MTVGGKCYFTKTMHQFPHTLLRRPTSMDYDWSFFSDIFVSKMKSMPAEKGLPTMKLLKIVGKIN